MPPELQKQIDELAEQAVDDWVEYKHAHEIVPEQPNDALVDESDNWSPESGDQYSVRS